MPRRVINSISVVVWDAPAQNKRRFEGGEQFQSDLFFKHTSKDVVLPAAAAGPPVVPSSEAVDLGDFGTGADGARGIYVQSDVDVELLMEFDDGGVQRTIPLVRPGPVGVPVQMYLDCRPTSLTVQNSNTASQANVVVALWGSETPA